MGRGAQGAVILVQLLRQWAAFRATRGSGQPQQRRVDRPADGPVPLPRPGGWNLIGRTPLAVVDVADGFFPLRVGDRVRFTRIDETEFHHMAGKRLVVT